MLPHGNWLHVPPHGMRDCMPALMYTVLIVGCNVVLLHTEGCTRRQAYDMLCCCTSRQLLEMVYCLLLSSAHEDRIPGALTPTLVGIEA